MNPKSVLNSQDYQSLFQSFFNHESPDAFLNGCEKEYLSINKDFFHRLSKEIKNAGGKDLRTLNDLLIANPRMSLEEAKEMVPNLKKLEQLSNLVKKRINKISPCSLEKITCTSNIFRRDLNELCEDCPIRKIISDGIKKQIIFHTIQQEEILPKTEFNEYLKAEMSKAGKEMKKIYLIELQNDYFQNHKDRHSVIFNYLWNKERIKALKTFWEEPKEEKKSNSEFTTTRQVLAIYYWLNYSQVRFEMINKTDLARFTQFLTGKEANNTKIANTAIYQKWKNLFGKSEKKNVQDLVFIKSFFDSLGLSEISKMIDNDIKNEES